jgi:hypothetical protein
MLNWRFFSWFQGLIRSWIRLVKQQVRLSDHEASNDMGLNIHVSCIILTLQDLWHPKKNTHKNVATIVQMTWCDGSSKDRTCTWDSAIRSKELTWN